jgi:hypothetical protein
LTLLGINPDETPEEDNRWRPTTATSH